MTPAAPITIAERKVSPEWLDYNGHMNVAYYTMAFDEALETVFDDHLGIGEDYLKERHASTFTVEMHIRYIQELREGDAFRIDFRLLDYDAKRLHFFMHMHHARRGYLSAICEQMLLHVDMRARKSAPFPADVQQTLSALLSAHQKLPRPENAGRVIGIKR